MTDLSILKERGAAKTSRIPIKVVSEPILKKPEWIRTNLPATPRFQEIKKLIRDNNLHTVCEEATCPNIVECFSGGTATFMILGDVCTRRCPFCDVAHGKPIPPDVQEPENLAKAVGLLKLNYVVITSVDRDDLRDGGAGHFASCVQAIRLIVPNISIEILVPDFRGRLEKALSALDLALPDVLNHNIETVARLYKKVRPGASYAHSLKLLNDFKSNHPEIPTKSGLMLGLGETDKEVLEVMMDLRNHGVEILTLGQYLQPTQYHLPVTRFVEPLKFKLFEESAYELGYRHVSSGPMVRSSYHAAEQVDSTR